MENPNAELEITRDEKGNVTGLAYKVTEAGKDEVRAAEFVEIATVMLATEGPENHSTLVDVNLSFPIVD